MFKQDYKIHQNDMTTQDIEQVDSNHGILSELLRDGGVSICNLKWSSPTQAAEPAFSEDSPIGAVLSLTMDLLEHGEIGSDTAKKFRAYWPERLWPLVLIQGKDDLNPGLNKKLRDEILSQTDKPTVDLGIHSLRMAMSEAVDFDRVLFGSALPVGTERVVLGAVFSENEDTSDVVFDRLNSLLTQFASNRMTISSLSKRLDKCNGNSIARVLVHSATNQIIWRNRIAMEHWDSVGRFATSLMRTRSAEDSEVSAELDALDLSLITFLRPKNKISRTPNPKIHQYAIPPTVRKRLHKSLI
ncbi:hypothetical protein JYT16_01930, partial [Gemmatimonas aurantiaca]|nr:hypothetical protein [Gemmatimonas aurantiaca]